MSESLLKGDTFKDKKENILFEDFLKIKKKSNNILKKDDKPKKKHMIYLG